MEQKQAVYGSLSRPTSADIRQEQKTIYIDPRHQDENPQPWLRYFFPRDFNVREFHDGSAENPFYQFFDVKLFPLEEDIVKHPPAWTPNAYFRLSFTQTNLVENQDIAKRQPDMSSPLDAIDFTQENWPIFAEGAEEHLKKVESFCRSVATFQARTWKDAFPLVDLLRGLLLYLLEQMLKGQQMAVEYAQRDAQREVEDQKARFAEEYAARLAAEKEAWEREAERRVHEAQEATRRHVTDELGAQMKQVGEDKDRWIQKCTQLELQVKKQHETINGLQRNLEQLQSQSDDDRAAAAKQLADKQNEIRALQERERALEDALAKARKAIADALKARTKDEVIAVATAAISATIPGSHSYASELRTTSTLGEAVSADFQAIQQLAAEDPDGQFAAGLARISPGFLSSPLADPELASGGVKGNPHVSPTRPTSATKGDGIAAGVRGGRLLNQLSPEEQATLVFKYVAASQDHQFMLGQKLSHGQGVSWTLADGGREVLVPDVGSRSDVHLFRGDSQAKAARGATLFTVPLLGAQGEFVGTLGVDNMGSAHAAGSGAGSLGFEDQAFVREMAAAINRAIAQDQQALNDLVLQAQLMHEAEMVVPDDGPVEVADPEEYADMPGGLKLFKEALSIMKGLSDADLDSFRNLEQLDDATLAVLRSVLLAAGEAADGDWDQLRHHINRELVDKLLAMDPNAAWAEWAALCKLMKPVQQVEADFGRVESLVADESAGSGEGLRTEGFGRATSKWLMAVRKISAALAFRKELESRLVKANAALMRMFQGDGSSALTELRSYRVPPKITFQVLQMVLLLGGEDCHSWGRMKVLTNYKMIKKMVDLKPVGMPLAQLKQCHEVVKNLDEDDVKQESTATLALFKWLSHFVAVGLAMHAAGPTSA